LQQRFTTKQQININAKAKAKRFQWIFLKVLKSYSFFTFYKDEQVNQQLQQNKQI